MFKSKKRPFLFVVLVSYLTVLPVFVSHAEEPAKPVDVPRIVPASPDGSGDTVINRTPKLEYYPCDDCHSSPADFNPTQRELVEEHLDKGVHYAKGPDQRWCHNCHEEGNYLKLHLLSGEEVAMNDAYLVCAQCHSTNYKDWLHNAHGKRVGTWNGPRQIYSCPECHDPHKPPFKKLQSVGKPIRPVNNFWRY